ncbi:MAG: hypothetical protein ACRCUQ_05165 [Alphaproteobacteria bacterium]
MLKDNPIIVKFLKFLSAAIFFQTISASYAGLSNQDLLKCCQSPSFEQKALCAAVLENTAQSIIFYRNLLDRQDVYLNVCFPENLSSDDLITTYIGWIKERPGLLSDAAFLGATSALSTAYSCKKNKPSKLKDAFKQAPPQLSK